MAEPKSCPGCDQKNKCQETYQQLGKAQGQSIALDSVVAFLLPLLIFIVSLGIFDRILAGTIELKDLRIAISFLLALFVTFTAMLIIKLISKHLGKNKYRTI
ncbi:MAG: SoxR reducing system RseC family protein [Phycisphaerae bacterium]